MNKIGNWVKISGKINTKLEIKCSSCGDYRIYLLFIIGCTFCTDNFVFLPIGMNKTWTWSVKISGEQLYYELFSHRTSVHASCYYIVGWPDAGQVAILWGIDLNLTLAYDKKNNCTYLLFLSARHFVPF